jgi:hypothetical protein
MLEHSAPPGSRGLEPNGGVVEPLLETGGFSFSTTEDDLKSPGESDILSPDHRDYLLQRHGTLDLTPLPSADPADPLNWPQSKVYLVIPCFCESQRTDRIFSLQKNINLALLSANGLLAISTSSSIIPTFEALSKALQQSVQNITYLTGAQVCILDSFPEYFIHHLNRLRCTLCHP